MRAASLLGWRPLEIDHAPDPQLEVPATRAAASFALWRGDVGDARRAVERGWALVLRAEDWALAARMAAIPVKLITHPQPGLFGAAAAFVAANRA